MALLLKFQEKQVQGNGWVKKVFKFKYGLDANAFRLVVTRKSNSNKPVKVKGIKIKACFNPKGKPCTHYVNVYVLIFLAFTIDHMSLVMRKPDFCICAKLISAFDFAT